MNSNKEQDRNHFGFEECMAVTVVFFEMLVVLLRVIRVHSWLKGKSFRNEVGP